MKTVEKKIVPKEDIANYLDEGSFMFDTENSKHFFSVCFKVPVPYCPVCGRTNPEWKKGEDLYCADVTAHHAVTKSQSQGEIVYDEIWTGKLRSLHLSKKSGILQDGSYLEIKGFQSPFIENWRMGTEVKVPFSRILYLVHTEILYDGNCEFMKTIEKTFFAFHDKNENASMLESMTATA